ncbi:RraA family protein [Hoyosella subflava]|uniref:Putative 4-hydroxy-4-methyl-2-oxoglutarate aldolase n=1 Tax=Hoyosella subflava (strain DSM 45089 / JCM 17490 / NBRC 109087 / DQS3-9A1) TaxID=443218 RepID=F6EGT1_HOYSD|nr:RraA family protein [Hoyosella subflava]AEF42319.1 Methyltransferase [Hoyosella subflava DQS3-9A1]
MADVSARLTGAVPASKICRVDVPRYDEHHATTLLALDDMSAAVADALDKLGVGADIDTESLRPILPDNRVCGPAVTLRYRPLPGSPARNRENGEGTVFGDRDLYGLGQAGDVAVFDCSGARSGAVVGALSARWAVKAGIVGCIVDGPIRDTASIEEAGLPVWSATRRPMAARYRYDLVELNGTVSLRDHAVTPGDYIVADRDGVCIIPFAAVPDVVDHCLAAQRDESAFIDRIDAASSLEELIAGLGPGPNPA